MRRARQTTPLNVGVYILVLVSLQIFLVMVALEAFITFDTRLAWAAAATSVALALLSALFYRFLRQATAARDAGPTRAVRREPR